MAFLPDKSKYKAGKIIGIYLCGIFGPNLSVMYSWAAANYAGHTKKVTINAAAEQPVIAGLWHKEWTVIPR